MKKNGIVLFVFVFFFAGLIASCGGGGGGDAAPAPKSLFSLWKTTNGTGVIDLSKGSFSQPIPFFMTFSSGAQCVCNFMFVGDQSSGGWSLSQCVYVPGSGTGDPGCSGENTAGTYTLINNILTLCDNSSQSCPTFN